MFGIAGSSFVSDLVASNWWDDGVAADAHGGDFADLDHSWIVTDHAFFADADGKPLWRSLQSAASFLTTAYDEDNLSQSGTGLDVTAGSWSPQFTAHSASQTRTAFVWAGQIDSAVSSSVNLAEATTTTSARVTLAAGISGRNVYLKVGGTIVSTQPAAPTDSPCVVAAEIDQTTYKIWVNGALAASGSHSESFTLDGDVYHYTTYTGTLAAFAVHHSASIATDILQIQADIAAYWQAGTLWSPYDIAPLNESAAILTFCDPGYFYDADTGTWYALNHPSASFAQSSSGLRPTYDASNNLLEFPASDDKLEGNADALTALNSGFTDEWYYATVMEYTSATNYRYLVSCWGSSLGTSFNALGRSWNSDAKALMYTAPDHYITTFAAPTSVSFFGGGYDEDSQDIWMDVGATRETTSKDSNDRMDFTITESRIAGGYTANTHGRCSIGMVVFLNEAPSTSERDAWRTALSDNELVGADGVTL